MAERSTRLHLAVRKFLYYNSTCFIADSDSHSFQKREND